MYKEVLRSIDGVAIYPIMSLVIFGLFFTALIVYVVKVDKELVQKMKDLPLVDTQKGKIESSLKADKQ